MMAGLATVLGILLPVVIAATFLLTRHLYRGRAYREALSAVSRQHIELFQGGQLSEAAVESTKARFRDLLERGQVAAVEASLRPGTQYVVQVRALSEIGTEEAGGILERQLAVRLTDDLIEQSWYWIDLACGLRALNRSQSLPHLLRCAEAADEIPLGHFFAAETVCFLGFSGYLRQVEAPLGRSALRILHRALEGLRHGVPPQIVAESRLGELIEGLWDDRPGEPDPLVTRVFQEALRLLARTSQTENNLQEEASEAEAYRWQMSRLATLEPALIDYLEEAAVQLPRQLASAEATTQKDILLALADLRADAADVLLTLLTQARFAHADLAVSVLAWSQHPGVAPFLRGWVMRRIPLAGRALRRRRAEPPRRCTIPPDIPYRAILKALRGHPSLETEALLLLATHDLDPTYRAAALGSLGWCEPFRRAEVQIHLQDGRRDPNSEVRHAARAALARLGERQALQWFRQGLISEDQQRVHETIHTVANEGLTLLWPDLDRLADSEDPDICHHAREALARLNEDLEARRG